MTRRRIDKPDDASTRRLVTFRWAAADADAQFETVLMDGKEERWLADEPHCVGEYFGHSAGMVRRTRHALEVNAGEGKRSYDPSDPKMEARFTAIHVALALTEPTEQGVLGFARRFGRLGLREPLGFQAQKDGLSVETGERFESWRDCIDLMRLAVALLWSDDEWNMRRKKLVHERVDEYCFGERERRQYADKWLAEIPKRVDFGDNRSALLREPSVQFLDVETRRIRFSNRERSLRFGVHGPLEKNPIARREYFAFLVEEMLGDECQVQLVSSDDGMRLALAPTSLWHYVWLELAESASSDSNYFTCMSCGSPFSAGSGKSRADRLFCSPACKQANLDWREATVRRMWMEAPGIDADTIVGLIYRSPQVDSEEKRAKAAATVQRWLDHYASH